MEENFFWKKNFPSKLSVGWKEFISCLFKEMGTPLPDDPQFKSLSKDSTKNDLMRAGKAELKAYAKIDSDCAKKAKNELARRTKGSTDMYRIIAEDGDMTDDLRNIYSLKALLNADSSEVVSVDEFGKLLERLGPLNITDEPDGLLDRIADLVCKPWFHGEIPTKTAESMLRVATPGTFLVRFSNSSRNSYCISSVSPDKKVKHIVIAYKSGKGVELSGKIFSGIRELVEENETRLHLTTPCPGSKFAWLHASEEDVAAVVGYGVDY